VSAIPQPAEPSTDHPALEALHALERLLASGRAARRTLIAELVLRCPRNIGARSAIARLSQLEATAHRDEMAALQGAIQQLEAGMVISATATYDGR